MLSRLSIQNYAIIDELEISFSVRLNIITGETGAGKSIIMGALGLILGDRADSSSLLNKEKKSIVEGVFAIKNKNEKEWHLNFQYQRHVGMYMYKSNILKQISSLKPTQLETVESLEQLRWLENGFKIKCVQTNFESHCVDTPEDLEKIIKMLSA